MSQRDSGYARKERDFYETPDWVTAAVIPHLPDVPEFCEVWEPAAGQGKMARVLQAAGYKVVASDIEPCPGIEPHDFLTGELLTGCGAVITNPPYDRAEKFIHMALAATDEESGFVAMLLRTDFDHAKSRASLFRDSPIFCKKVVLMRRIVWFVEADGKPKASPSYNHAWYIWDWRHEGPPTIAYA